MGRRTAPRLREWKWRERQRGWNDGGRGNSAALWGLGVRRRPSVWGSLVPSPFGLGRSPASALGSPHSPVASRVAHSAASGNREPARVEPLASLHNTPQQAQRSHGAVAIDTENETRGRSNKEPTIGLRDACPLASRGGGGVRHERYRRGSSSTAVGLVRVGCEAATVPARLRRYNSLLLQKRANDIRDDVR